MTPSFNYQTIEWTNELWREMESCWNKLGENYELDLIKWMRRFTNEMIFRISTGVKNDAVSSYYNFIVESNSFKGKKEELVDESSNFVESIEVYIKGFIYIFTFSKFVRNYFPFVRGEWNKIIKNRDYLFDRVHAIIKDRRTEIE